MYSFGQIMAGGLNTVSGPFHPFGGAVDIIVVKQEDGTYKSTPFYVRFGKFQGVLKRREKVVNVAVNVEEANFCMYLDHRGQAYFLHEKEVEELVTENDPTAMFSPGGSSGDEGSRTVPQLLLETPSGNFKEATLDDLGSLKKGQGLVLTSEEGAVKADGGSFERLPSPPGEDENEREQGGDLRKAAAEGGESQQDRLKSSSDGKLDVRAKSPRGYTRSASAPPESHPSPAEVELRSVLSMAPKVEGNGYSFEDTDAVETANSVSLEEQAILERDQVWRKVVRRAAKAVEASPPLLKPPASVHETTGKDPKGNEPKGSNVHRSNSWGDLSRRTSEEDAVMQEHPDKASWGWGSWWYKSPPEGAVLHPSSRRPSQSETGSSRKSSYQTGDEDPGVNDPKEVILGFQSARNSFADFGVLSQENSDGEGMSPKPPRSIFSRLFGSGAGPPPAQTPVRKLQRTDSQEGFSRKGGRLDVNSDFQEDLDGVLKQKIIWGPAPEKKQEEVPEPGEDFTGGVGTGPARTPRNKEVEALSDLADDLLKEKGPGEGVKTPKRAGKVGYKKEGLQGLMHRTSSGGFSDVPGSRLRNSFPKIDEVSEVEKESQVTSISTAERPSVSESGRFRPSDQSRKWKRRLSRKDSESDGDGDEIEFTAGGHALEASIIMAELENTLLEETAEEEQRTEERLKEEPLLLWDGMGLEEAVTAFKKSVGGEEGARLEELLRSRSKKWLEEGSGSRRLTSGVSGASEGVSSETRGVSEGVSGSPEGVSVAPEGVNRGFSGAPEGVSGMPEGVSGATKEVSGTPEGVSGLPKGVSAATEGLTDAPERLIDASTGVRGVRKKESGAANEVAMIGTTMGGEKNKGEVGVDNLGIDKGVLSRGVRSRLRSELAAQFVDSPEGAVGASEEPQGGGEAEAEFLAKQKSVAKSEPVPSSSASNAGTGPEAAAQNDGESGSRLQGFAVKLTPSSLSTVRSAPLEIPGRGSDSDGLQRSEGAKFRRAASLPGVGAASPTQGAPFAELRDRLRQLEGSNEPSTGSSQAEDVAQTGPDSSLVSAIILDQPLAQSAPVSGINTPLVCNPDSKAVTEPGTMQNTPPNEPPALVRSYGKPPLSRGSPLKPLVTRTGSANLEDSSSKTEGGGEGSVRADQTRTKDGISQGVTENPGEPTDNPDERPGSLHGEEVSDASDPLRSTAADEGVAEGGHVEVAEAKPETAMELSLCRHLLLPGMGVEAATAAFDSEAVSFDKFISGPHALISNERLVCRVGGRYYPWKVVAPTLLGMLAFGRVVPTFNGTEFDGAIPVEKQKAPKAEGDDTAQPGTAGWRLWPFGSRGPGQRPQTPDRSGPRSEGTNSPEPAEAARATTPRQMVRRKRKCKLRTLIPTSEELASLNLRDGKNKITFGFTTRVWGKQEVDATIHLWRWNSRVIISDVDGTITRSDLMGQIAPLIGRDWSQSGVASLFSSIKGNGYEFMYLSARAISQSATTRAFLSGIRQDGKSLPDGPIVISPDGMIPSLYREVIRRTPHEFKIACLNEIRALFPPNTTPFYAGFGNRDTDEISYLAVGIARGKIFTINPKGEVVANKVSVDVCGYSSMRRLVHDMFPSVNRVEQEDYNSWNYWKIPVPEIDDDELLESKKREDDERKREEVKRREDAKKREEAKRKDELRRKEEEKKRLEDARKKKVEDDKRKREEDKRRAADDKRKAADDKRRAEDDKRKAAEGKRRAEDDKRRVEEEGKKKTEDERRRMEEGKKKVGDDKRRKDEDEQKTEEEKRNAEGEKRQPETDGKRQTEDGKGAEQGGQKTTEHDERKAKEEKSKRAEQLDAAQKEEATRRTSEERRRNEERKRVELFEESRITREGPEGFGSARSTFVDAAGPAAIDSEDGPVEDDEGVEGRPVEDAEGVETSDNLDESLEAGTSNERVLGDVNTDEGTAAETVEASGKIDNSGSVEGVSDGRHALTVSSSDNGLAEEDGNGAVTSTGASGSGRKELERRVDGLEKKTNELSVSGGSD